MNFVIESDKAINLDDIINEINENFTISLKKILTPFVDRVNSIDRSHRAISETLRKIPEFRDLVSENEELKNELIEFKRSYVEYPSVTLKVTEKERGNEDTNTIVDQVYLDVDLPPYGENVDTLANTVDIYNTDDSSAGDDDSSAGDDGGAGDDDSSAGDDGGAGDDDSSAGDDNPVELVNSQIIFHVINDDNDNIPLDERSEISDVEITSVGNNNSNDDVCDNSNDDDDSVENINEEVYIIEIHNKGTFYTDDEMNGIIYTIEDDDEIGERVGIFNDGIEVFD